VDLFASRTATHYQLWFSVQEEEGWPGMARASPLCLSPNSTPLVRPETSAGEASQAHSSGSLLPSNALGWAVASLSGQTEAVHLDPGVERVLSLSVLGE
jgi:hypothetical protein